MRGGSLLIGFFHQISGNILYSKRIALIFVFFISFVSDITKEVDKYTYIIVYLRTEVLRWEIVIYISMVTIDEYHNFICANLGFKVSITVSGLPTGNGS